MRSAQKNNRSRGRGNRKSGGGNIINRVYDSAGPEGKVRGTPQQIIDKYLSLARDAQTTGDRVVAENFLQHAEHYQRLLIQAAAQQEQNRRDQAESGQDGDGDGDGDERDGPRDGTQGGRRGQQQRQEAGTDTQQAASAGSAASETSRSEEIGGMAMIDSGNAGGDDLLVAPEDAPKSKPRRNGDGRRRRQRQDSDAAQQDSATETEQPAGAQQEN